MFGKMFALGVSTMCITRNWNTLESPVDRDIIFAKRSDNVIFKFYIEEFKNIKDFVSRLESYRNCNCSQTAPCDLHKLKGENKSARTN